ncbi:MAG: nitroreductase family protein [Candidatus Lernaella stagnicola]|nr:nitroreductase family protein [Candidatus Lernaella stagnicola]
MDAQVIQLLQKRHATRAIDSEKLPDEFVTTLIEAARLTPSCFNNQPWRFLFLLSDQALEKGAACLSKGNEPWAHRAPLLIVGYAAKEDDCQIKDGREYYQFDLGMSVMNIMMAATELGLVARPMAGFGPDAVREQFDIPPGAEPLVMIAVGRPTDDESHLPDHAKGKSAEPRQRKDATEIVTRL